MTNYPGLTRRIKGWENISGFYLSTKLKKDGKTSFRRPGSQNIRKHAGKSRTEK